MHTETSFSIIIPCYNHALYIDQCLDSVFNQTFQNWECLIVNDGSTDNSWEKMLHWANKDKRFKIFHSENKGVSHARNIAIQHATGLYLFPLDSDDYITNDYLENINVHIRENPSADIIQTPLHFFGEKNFIEPIIPFDKIQQLISGAIAIGLIKTALAKKVDGYDENMQYAEDWEFWIRASLRQSVTITNVNSSLYYYRIRNQDDSLHEQGKKNESQKQTLTYIWNKHKDLYYQLGPNFLLELSTYKRKEYILERSRLYQLTKRLNYWICKLRYGKKVREGKVALLP